jgi:Acyl carrier protein
MNGASMPTVIERVRQYILENYLYMRPDARLGEDEPLLANGIIDSMGVMELIAFLEDEFSVTVGDTEITEANFGSLRTIAEFVLAKQPDADGRHARSS